MWDNLKASIASVVRTNDNQEITGANLQNVLNTIVNTVGANATFAGIAVPSTNPGTPDGPVFYIACEPGIYSNFNLTLINGLYILENKTGSWVGTQINTGAAFEALIGYYNAVLNGASITVPDATTYRLTIGGDFKLKMLAPGTTATTLTIGNATNIPIWYNGAAVSAQNTWEANEIISVFYDGTCFMASNSQGGGGRAEKIKYDNSLSGLNADNVQDAIEEVGFVNANTEIDLSQYTEVRAYISPDGKWITTNNSYKWYGIFVPVTPSKRYRIVANSSGATGYAFLTSNTVGINNRAVTTFAAGCSRVSVSAGESVSDTAPSDAAYMWVFTTHTTTGDRKPRKIIIMGDSVVDKLANIDSVPTESSKNLVESGGVYEKISEIGTLNTEGVPQPDLDIIDENGNVLVRFEGGHIKTKNFDSSKMSITVPSSLTFDTSYDTDIVATTRNYILREVAEGGTDYFYFSDDCGKTWSKNVNTIGKLTFIHFFSNGVILLCCNDYCYTTTDFVTFTRSSVYDYDGSEFVSNTSAHSFYRLGNYGNEYHELNGQEVLIWNDYNINSGYVSRVWMSLDYGATIRCILKNGTTKDTNNNTISVRHFHRVCLEDEYGILWVTSGDSGAQCRLTKGTYSNGSWTWETIGTPGALYKLSQLEIKRPYAYFVTDYTDDVTPTGIVTCPVASLNDSSAFKYIYKTDNNDAMSKLFEDGNGNRVLVGDGAVYNTIWLARGNYDFKEVQVSFSSSTLTFGNIIGANFLGQVICFYNPNGGYSAAGNQFLSDKVRFLFSDWMRDNGLADFGSINSLI